MFRVICGILRRCHAVPSGRIAPTRLRTHLCYTPVPWKQKEVNIRSLLWSFQWFMYLLCWLPDFIFQTLAIPFSTLASTLPVDAAHLPWHPSRDLLLRRKVKLGSQEMLHSVHLPASYRNYNYESMEFLGFNDVTYIYHKVGLFQIMWLHTFDVKECMHRVLTP